MTDSKTAAVEGTASDATPSLEPSKAEIDAWAEREKKRRQEWLAGPNDDERAEYATYLRRRRLAEAFDEGEAQLQERMRQGLHYTREAQLAAEGAMALIFRWSRRRYAEMVRAGREWEEDTVLPRTRRRVPLDDEGS